MKRFLEIDVARDGESGCLLDLSRYIDGMVRKAGLAEAGLAEAGELSSGCYCSVNGGSISLCLSETCKEMVWVRRLVAEMKM